MTQDNPDLRTCPFCGGAATRQTHTLPQGGFIYATGCDNAGCTVLPCATQMSPEAADDAWNGRPSLTGVSEQELLTEMRDALPDAISIFRAMRRADGRRHFEMAEQVERELIALTRAGIEKLLNREGKA